jgi:hypothetical protein
MNSEVFPLKRKELGGFREKISEMDMFRRISRKCKIKHYHRLSSTTFRGWFKCLMNNDDINVTPSPRFIRFMSSNPIFS